jgi:ubiquinone/menaquinone biosynthesis C-methylase UbiE
MSERKRESGEFEDWSRLMKRDWDERARSDAKWFINPSGLRQSDSEFDKSGAIAVEQLVVYDLDLLAPLGDSTEMRVLELGSGIGRMTRFLAELFAEVHATDVSCEMIRQAKTRLSDLTNVHFHETSGYDFAGLPSEYFDIVFSAFVFEHVPSAEIIRSNLRDAFRVLKPGAFLKFQTNSLTAFDFEEIEKDTWMGASLPESEIRRFAEEVDAQVLSLTGGGSKHCWTILRKRPNEPRPRVAMQPQIVYYGQTDHPSVKEIPINGSHNSLTLLVEGFDPEIVDCNSVCATISGLEVFPHYVGPVRASFRARSDLEGVEKGVVLTRIDVSLPVGVPTGAADVRVQLTTGETSPPVCVHFVSPEQVIPFIKGLALRGGDEKTANAEELLCLDVEGLDETADSGNIRVLVGGRILKPARVNRGSHGHQVDVLLPGDVSLGTEDVQLYFGNLPSQPVRFVVPK